MYLALDLYAVTRGMSPANHCNPIFGVSLKTEAYHCRRWQFPGTSSGPVQYRQLYDCGFFQRSIAEIRKFIHPLINHFGIDHRQNNTVIGYHPGGQPALIFETDHCIR